ncbi:MAG: hypothetical protein JO079_01130, partial [Frankiaceae bacterium]|nr:hypothetical protein [Frankiaceae bacterium]
MPGPALVTPWSPIGRRASTTGLIALAVAAAAGLALLLAPAAGTDLAAQQARAAFAAHHPGAAVDFGWFRAVFPAAYSVLTPYVEAVLGPRLAGILAAVAGAPLLALLLVKWGVRRPLLASVWGALALVANMASGRTAFALGLTAGIAALLLVPARGSRWVAWIPAAVAAFVTTLASPVAALFLGIVAVVWALHRRGVVALAVAAAVPLAAIGLLFAERGSMPDAWSVTRPLLLGCLAVVVLCRAPLLRIGAVFYAVIVLVIYAVPGPVGSNIERLGLLFTGLALAADAALPVPLLLVAVVVAGQWTARDPWRDLHQTSALATEHAAAHRLVRILDRLGPLTGRVEVVPFLDHGEADVVVEHALLARGWERQLDTVRAATLYRPGLTAAQYVGWLRAHHVQYVALGRHRHDWSAGSELRVLAAPVPGLKAAYLSPEWLVWSVDYSPPVVTGAGHAVRLGRASIVVAADGTGPVRVDVPWSRWLTVSAGACVRRDDSGVAVVPSRAGTYVLTSSYGAA